MTAAEIADNVMAYVTAERVTPQTMAFRCIKPLTAAIPGHRKNIQAIRTPLLLFYPSFDFLLPPSDLKTTESVSLPIFNSLPAGVSGFPLPVVSVLGV
jgi:hypothetical protein